MQRRPQLCVVTMHLDGLVLFDDGWGGGGGEAAAMLYTDYMTQCLGAGCYQHYDVENHRGKHP